MEMVCYIVGYSFPHRISPYGFTTLHFVDNLTAYTMVMLLIRLADASRVTEQNPPVLPVP